MDDNIESSTRLRATFVSDAPFYEENGSVYTFGGFPYRTWLRYLRIFSSLTVVGRKAEVRPAKLVISAGPQVTFKQLSVPGKIGWILKRKKILDNLESALNETDFAIIRVPTTMGQYAIDLCQKNNKPYLLEVVGCPYDALKNHGSLIGKVLAPWRRLKMKRQVAKARHVISVTEHFLQSRYPNTYSSANVSNVSIDHCLSKEEAMFFYSRPSDTLRIGMIGAFNVKYKGHLDALKAIKEIIRTNSLPGKKIHLSMVGTGDYEWLKQEVNRRGLSESISLLGALPPGEGGILPFLDELHMFIQPSLTEGLPRTLIEAMSRGKVCVASNVGGIPELLPPAYLHDPGDWKKLASLIVQHGKEVDYDSSLRNLVTAKKYLNSTLTERRTAFITNAAKTYL